MLKRVHIQNFKSLKDVTLDLQPVNLLIGPNNSGKTNFLKALEFLKKLYDGTKAEEHNLFGLLYEKGIITEKELLDVTFKKQRNPLKIKLSDENGSGLMANFFFDSLGNITTNTIKEHQFILNSLLGLNSLVIYKPDPNKLTQTSIVTTGVTSVNADASNLISFFDYLRDDQPETFTQIKSDLRLCISEFTEINFQSIPSNEELIKQFGPGTFKRIGLTNGEQGVKYWADELSEGTLYFLALLCIINQPNSPKLLLLEEPEKGIHPRRIKEVIEFIRQLAAEKDVQVIMTTHSPLLLDEFADSPESVFIFDKDEEGATHVKNLQRDVIEPDLELSRQNGVEPPNYTDSLGDSWKIGFLGGVPK